MDIHERTPNHQQNQLCWTYTGSAAQQSICGSPPSGATITTYDGDGHVLTVTDGNGNVTTNAYSDTGQLCWTYLGSSSNGCSSPPAGATVYTYDANGNLLTTTKPDGQPITNTYNTANQLCWTYQGVLNTPSCGSPPTSGTYAIFTHDPDGRVLTMTDPTGTSSWTYNALGQETSYTNGAGAEVQYTYDGNGNQTSITYPAGGIVVSEVYNADNQMCWTEVSSTISGNSCSSPPSGSTVYSYDASGNLLSEDLPNGVDNTYTYDGANNLMAISDKTSSGAPVFAATYARNGDDLVTSDSSQPAGAGQYEYTAKKQVCYAGSANSAACTSPPSGSYAYGYDPAGNLTGDNGTTQTFTSQDELCWSVTGSSSSPCSQPPAGATTYEYDANGDRTAVTPTTGTPAAYSYNTADQLTEYQLDGGTPTTYTYDGHGLRMSEATGSATTTFSWTDTGSVALLLQETTGAGTTSYVYGPAGSPIEEILPSGSVNYYSSDDLGSTRALTDASGNVQDTDTYDPYGNLTATTGSVQDHLLFQGQYLDSENGLYYLRARYYDPSTGQFLTVDPKVATTLSPYGYVQGDPLNGTDPSGEWGLPGWVTSAWNATGGHVVSAAQNLCLRNPFGAGWNSNSNGGCGTVLTGSQGAKLVAATVVIATVTVATDGLADQYIGAYLSAGEEGTALGTLDQIGLLLHAWPVFALPATIYGIGGYLIWSALTNPSTSTSGSSRCP